MNEPVRKPDELDAAAATFWLDADLSTMLKTVQRYEGPEQFVIGDLTDDEWAEFEAALSGEHRDTAVCVDTGVLTSALRLGSLLETRYRRHLTGRRLVIATQVVAEARHGALRAGWGDRRLADLERLLGSALVLVPDDLTASTFAGAAGL